MEQNGVLCVVGGIHFCVLSRHSLGIFQPPQLVGCGANLWLAAAHSSIWYRTQKCKLVTRNEVEENNRRAGPAPGMTGIPVIPVRPDLPGESRIPGILVLTGNTDDKQNKK